MINSVVGWGAEARWRCAETSLVLGVLTKGCRYDSVPRDTVPGENASDAVYALRMAMTARANRPRTLATATGGETMVHIPTVATRTQIGTAAEHIATSLAGRGHYTVRQVFWRTV
jgi:hypothetical protein